MFDDEELCPECGKLVGGFDQAACRCHEQVLSYRQNNSPPLSTQSLWEEVDRILTERGVRDPTASAAEQARLAEEGERDEAASLVVAFNARVPLTSALWLDRTSLSLGEPIVNERVASFAAEGVRLLGYQAFFERYRPPAGRYSDAEPMWNVQVVRL